MHSVVGFFSPQECCLEAVQKKFGEMKTGDVTHTPAGPQTALSVVLWALASDSGSF